MLRTVAWLLTMFLVAARPTTAQEPAASILEGVDSVGAEINLNLDSHIPGVDESTLRSRLKTVMELELRQRGIVVSDKASTYLVLTMIVVYGGDRTASYSYALLLFETGLPTRVLSDLVVGAARDLDYKRLNGLSKTDSVRMRLEMRAGMWDGFMKAYRDSTLGGWVATWWGAAGVGHVGTANLQDVLERKTMQKAQEFANAYLAAHPRQEH